MAETFLYLTTTGRKTGKPHSIEIWYVEQGDCYVLCAEQREKSDWVKNVQANPNVQFYVAERNDNVQLQAGTAELVTDAAGIQAIAPLFDAKYKWSEGLFMRICPEG
jgi:deazaflavin-dependent oxidoreductase (nitroreductase family)